MTRNLILIWERLMKLRFNAFILLCGVALFYVQTASAQTLTQRSSRLTYNYVYGAGGDSHVDNELLEDFTLLLSDNEQIGYTGETAGELPGKPPSPYTAGVSGTIEHEYSITGSIDAIESITASGSSEVNTAYTGAGIANMSSVNPGNEIIFYFTIDSLVQYHLVGSLDLPGPTAFSGVYFQYFDSVTWQTVYSTIVLPGTEGPFDVTGTLYPGEYRIISVVGVDAYGNETETANFQYTLSMRRKGDMNCDGSINGLDVQAFVEALLDPPSYATDYPDCNPLNGDMDSNSALTTSDVEPFAQAVLIGV